MKEYMKTFTRIAVINAEIEVIKSSIAYNVAAGRSYDISYLEDRLGEKVNELKEIEKEVNKWD